MFNRSMPLPLFFENITQKKFIQKLYLMGRLRGSIMHPDKFNASECDNVLAYLLSDYMPGEFFYKLGINIGY